jgi:hypothetical protein
MPCHCFFHLGIGSEVSTDNWLKNQKAFSSVLAGLKKAVGGSDAPPAASSGGTA